MLNSKRIVPASMPPDGVTPNLERPNDVYYTGNLVNLVVCAGFSNLIFFMHAYVKLAVRKTALLAEDCEL